MSSAIYPDPPETRTAVCGHGEQQRLSNARLRLTFYNGPVAYCGPARPGSAFQQSAVSGLLPRARARREIPEASARGDGEQPRRHLDAERPRGVEVDHQLELGRL